MTSVMKNNSISMKKPFCKVCFDARKDSAHYLRNAYGQTVCAYLLSLNCNNCRKTGHTAKYCKAPKKIIQQQQQQQSPVVRVPAVQMSQLKQEKPKEKSYFDVFQKLIQEEAQRESDELDKRLKEISHKTNFPEISEKTVAKKASDSILTGWSKVVGKPVKVYETLSEEEYPSDEEKTPVTEPTTFNPYIVGSWADCE